MPRDTKLDTSPFRRTGGMPGFGGRLLMPLPRCDAELAIVSEAYFGVPLGLSKLRVWGASADYEVKQRYNDYHGRGFKYRECCVVGYDHSRIFWDTVIGPIYCGGIAAHSYGQVRIHGFRHRKRLAFWTMDRRSARGSSPRSMFVRLAHRYGVGENIASENRPLASGVLTDGRADGASAASPICRPA